MLAHSDWESGRGSFLRARATTHGPEQGPWSLILTQTFTFFCFLFWGQEYLECKIPL